MTDFVKDQAEVIALQPTDFFYLVRKSATAGLPDLDRRTSVETFFTTIPSNLTVPNTALHPIKVQTITTAGGAVSVDFREGEYVILILEGDVTSFAITHWPTDGTLGKVTLEVRNQGAFGITGWSGVKWPTGKAPFITQGHGSIDLFVIHSGDGTVTLGSVAGQNYS